MSSGDQSVRVPRAAAFPLSNPGPVHLHQRSHVRGLTHSGKSYLLSRARHSNLALLETYSVANASDSSFSFTSFHNKRKGKITNIRH